MSKDKLGSGWDRQGESGKYVSVSLDLGVLGDVSLAVFENTRRDAERKQPTHNLVFSPDEGKRRYVGAFWTKTGKEGKEYLMGRLALNKLERITIGGAIVDFSKAEVPIDAKIVRAATQDGKGPHYHVFRVAPKAAAPGVGSEEE